MNWFKKFFVTLDYKFTNSQFVSCCIDIVNGVENFFKNIFRTCKKQVRRKSPTIIRWKDVPDSPPTESSRKILEDLKGTPKFISPKSSTGNNPYEVKVPKMTPKNLFPSIKKEREEKLEETFASRPLSPIKE